MVKVPVYDRPGDLERPVMAQMLAFPVPVADGVVSPPLAPDAPAIDRTHLFRMTLGDHDLECEVLQLFDQQAGLLLARMAEADAAGVAALAHTLKGSARGVGAFGVARAAEAVEDAAKAKTSDKTGSAELVSAMSLLSSAIVDAHAAIAEILQA
jgi:HPt (histidine-containing phosphotransfer) domain-containing protein